MLVGLILCTQNARMVAKEKRNFMATRTADIHIRIQPDVKKQAEQIFAEGGFTLTDGIEQFLSWTVRHKKAPIRLQKRRPNIPVLADMTREEIRAMCNESEARIQKGEFYTSEEIRERLVEEFGVHV